MTSKILLTAVVIVSGAATLGGCKGAPSTGQRPDTKTAEVTARRFFAALARKDCPAVNKIIGGALARRIRKKGGCAYLFEQDPLAKVRLLRVSRSRRDGRDTRAFIVSVVLDKKGKEQQVDVRIVRKGRAFRLEEI